MEMIRTEKERGVGWARRKVYFLLFSFGEREDRRFFSFVSFVYSSFSFVRRPTGVRRLGSPSRTD